MLTKLCCTSEIAKYLKTRDEVGVGFDSNSISRIWNHLQFVKGTKGQAHHQSTSLEISKVTWEWKVTRLTDLANDPIVRGKLFDFGL